MPIHGVEIMWAKDLCLHLWMTRIQKKYIFVSFKALLKDFSSPIFNLINKLRFGITFHQSINSAKNNRIDLYTQLNYVIIQCLHDFAAELS